MSDISSFEKRDDVPVVIADDGGRITFVNRKFTEQFGWSEDEARGQMLTIIIPAPMRDSHHMGFSRFLETGRGTLLDKPITLKACAKDGTEFDAEHTIIADKEEGRWRFAATIRPLP